jgi:hypothetical protein
MRQVLSAAVTEPIAHSVVRLDESESVRKFELTAQVRDMGAQNLRVLGVPDAPHVFEQRGMGE